MDIKQCLETLAVQANTEKDRAVLDLFHAIIDAIGLEEQPAPAPEPEQPEPENPEEEPGEKPGRESGPHPHKKKHR